MSARERSCVPGPVVARQRLSVQVPTKCARREGRKLVEPLDRVQPCRIIRHYGAKHPLHERETKLEEYRKVHYSAVPSRMHGIFACTLPRGALFQDPEHQRSSDLIYQEEVIDLSGEPFFGYLSAVGTPELYWAGVPPDHRSAEVLLNADLKIIRRVL